jgi:hypothetical protein
MIFLPQGIEKTFERQTFFVQAACSWSCLPPASTVSTFC